MVKTAFDLRLNRARRIVSEAPEVVDVYQSRTMDNGSKRVYATVTGSREYRVMVEFDSNGILVGAECSCPDYDKMTKALERLGGEAHNGIPTHRGVLVCKHVLAVAIVAHKRYFG